MPLVKKMKAYKAFILLLLSVMIVGSCSSTSGANSVSDRVLRGYAREIASNPDRLYNRKPSDVLGIFSIQRPNLQRHEMDLVIWQIERNNCVIDLFWDKADATAMDDATLGYYEWRDTSGNILETRAQRDSCFS